MREVSTEPKPNTASQPAQSVQDSSSTVEQPSGDHELKVAIRNLQARRPRFISSSLYAAAEEYRATIGDTLIDESRKLLRDDTRTVKDLSSVAHHIEAVLRAHLKGSGLPMAMHRMPFEALIEDSVWPRITDIIDRIVIEAIEEFPVTDVKPPLGTKLNALEALSEIGWSVVNISRNGFRRRETDDWSKGKIFEEGHCAYFYTVGQQFNQYSNLEDAMLTILKTMEGSELRQVKDLKGGQFWRDLGKLRKEQLRPRAKKKKGEDTSNWVSPFSGLCRVIEYMKQQSKAESQEMRKKAKQESEVVNEEQKKGEEESDNNDSDKTGYDVNEDSKPGDLAKIINFESGMNFDDESEEVEDG